MDGSGTFLVVVMAKFCMVCGEKTENKANFCMNCGAKFLDPEAGSEANITANQNSVKGNLNIKKGENYRISRNKVGGNQYNINGDYNTVKSEEYILDNNFNIFEWAAKLLFKYFSRDQLKLGWMGGYAVGLITFLLSPYYEYKYGSSQVISPPDIHDAVFIILFFTGCVLLCVGYVTVNAITYYDFTFCKKCNKPFSYQRLESICVDHKGKLIQSHTDIETRYHCPTCGNNKTKKSRIY